MLIFEVFQSLMEGLVAVEEEPVVALACIILVVLIAVAAKSLLSYMLNAYRSESRVSVEPLQFNHDMEVHEFQWSRHDDPYLKELRTRYRLDQLVAGLSTDIAKIHALSTWVSGRWNHDGTNSPEPGRDDPISILEDADRGKRFRCVEYAVVLEGALYAIGIPARRLGLKAADVETRDSGAGHVVVEAYLTDQRKWIMVD